MAPNSEKTTSFQTEVDRVTGLLRDEIYDGRRLPNTHLTEKNLADDYSVSRMVVRQALSRLESYGLVDIQAFKGAKVASFRLERIREEYEVTAALEGFAAELATPRITRQDLKRLADIIEKQQAVSEQDGKNRLKLNRRFHSAIYNRCGNDRLIEVINHHSQFTHYWFFSSAVCGLSQNIVEHQNILEALKNKNGEKVRKLLVEHKLSNCENLIEHIRKNVPLGIFN